MEYGKEVEEGCLPVSVSLREREARRADSLPLIVQAEPAGGFSDDEDACSRGTAASPFPDRPLSGLTRAVDPAGLPDPPEDDSPTLVFDDRDARTPGGALPA